MPENIECPFIASADPIPLADIRARLSFVKPLLLRQAWRTELQEAFRPGEVRLAHDQRHLFIHAHLTDDDIFNPVAGFNEVAFTKGDVFEIFIGPVHRPSYREFHITPAGGLLQLAYPDRATIVRLRKDPFEPSSLDLFKVRERQAEVFTYIKDGEFWEVFFKISMDFDEIIAKTGRFKVSFGRYDHTRGKNEPVLSSTSMHSVADFHRKEDWTLAQFTSAGVLP